jgi:hypothetical protein
MFICVKLFGLDMYREWKKIEFQKRVLYMNLESTRPTGRPRNRWQDEVREDGRRMARNGRILHMPLE